MNSKNEWYGLYKRRFRSDVTMVPGAMQHPAKFAPDLIDRILTHAIENNWIADGGMIFDPFAGVASGGFGAALRGMNWIGMELEANWFDEAAKNVELWSLKFDPLVRGGIKVINSDSRKAVKFLEANQVARPGDFDLIITSPPYENIEICKTTGSHSDPNHRRELRSEGVWDGYNKDNEDNLGSMAGAAFWGAVGDVLGQCFELLKPRGHLISVTKNFVKAGKIVPFSAQWLDVCEAKGFSFCCGHRAMMVETYGVQAGLFGDDVSVDKSYKSFFRTLQEKKGAPNIDWEDVLCFTKGVEGEDERVDWASALFVGDSQMVDME